MFTAIASLVLVATIGQAAFQEDSTQQGADEAMRASLARMIADLSDFELAIDTEPPQELALAGAAVLRWNYPIRNVDDAAVFVWLHKEQPAAIATVLSYRDRAQNLRRAYEFLSLSPDRLSAVKAGQRVWHPAKPGLTWREVPNAPTPADTSAGRRRQMRDLAAQFQVSVTSDKNRYELRLLTQPLYRYQNARADVLDGCLFALVEGTDPEVILALESSVNEPGWKFAAGRLTRWAIEIRHQDKVVREFEQISGTVDDADVYHISDAGPLDPASRPQAGSRRP